MARCGCGTASCSCSVIAGQGVTVSGSGDPANPYVVSATAVGCDVVRACLSAGDGITYNAGTGQISAEPVTCDQVRPCISAAPGLTYNPATGQMAPDVSGTPGNALTVDGGGLYAPATAGVTAACGLDGTGTPGDPLSVAVGAWPYACALGAEGGGVYCDPNTGQLKGEPQVRMDFFGQTFNAAYPGGVAVPVAATVVESFSVDVTNPDPCRDAFVIFMRQVDVDFTLPPGGEAMSGVNGDQMTFDINSGGVTQDLIHHQAGKIGAGTLAAGASQTFTVDVLVGRGAGGAEYNRIQSDIHVWVISNPS